MTLGYMCGTVQEHAYSAFLLNALAAETDEEIFVHAFDDGEWRSSFDQIKISSGFSAITYPFKAAYHAYKKDIDVYHVQMELSNFGHPFGAFLLPIFLLLLRLLSIEAVVTIHGPIFAPQDVKEGLETLAPTPIVKPAMAPAIRYLFTATVYLSSTVVVHGNVFKQRLGDVYNVPTDDVEVIHHGVV